MLRPYIKKKTKTNITYDIVACMLHIKCKYQLIYCIHGVLILNYFLVLFLLPNKSVFRETGDKLLFLTEF